MGERGLGMREIIDLLRPQRSGKEINPTVHRAARPRVTPFLLSCPRCGALPFNECGLRCLYAKERCGR